MMKTFAVATLCLLSGVVTATETYPLDSGGFIRDWLIGGPYPSYWVNNAPRGIMTDFLLELGGESQAAPRPGLTSEAEFRADTSKLIAGIGSTNEWGYKKTKIFPVTWRERHWDKSKAVISLNGMFAPLEDHIVAYAFCYVKSPEHREIKVRIGSDDDHKVWLNGKLLGGVNKSQAVVPDSSVYPAELVSGFNRLLLKIVDRTQDHGFCLGLSDSDGNPLTDVQIFLEGPNGDRESVPTARAETIDARELEAVRAENAVLEEQIGETDRVLAEVRGKQTSLAKSVEKLQHRRTKLYAQIEQAYAEKRKKLHSDPPAIDEPVRPATVLRRRICLNGDQWLAAVAAKPKDGQPAESVPPSDTAWRPITLPLMMFSTYFRTWHYPLRNVDPKNRYGKVEPLPGWPDPGFNSLTCEDRTWFRKELLLSAVEASSSCTFVCENVSGKLKIYLNGTPCDEYFGNIGIVSIPLKGMTKGKNILDIYLEAPRTVGIPQGKFTTHWGLRGDLFLDITTPVAVAETDVKTSWREGRITVSTEIENRSTAPARVRMNQYCVLNNRIKYRFDARVTDIPADEKSIVENTGIWTETELWGIGGTYGKPVLYDLVTDVYVNGHLNDRHITPFGFREFWIAGTDFYLNGKRIILQGDVGLGGLTRKKLEILLPLLRADGINTIRIHDSDYWSPEFFRVCDRLGMLAYAQMYPILHERKPRKNQETGKREFIPYEAWLEHPLHTYNLRNYEQWVRMLRNHPSVAIAATDNEIFTQSWDRPESEAFNIRNDRLGAFYGRYVKSLNPSLVMTRDGDEGTWGHKGKWQEDPPCDTANYHYPDFSIREFVVNWQTVYDFRPAVFGETLYCSYGAWNDWIGAIPSQVQKKADTVRRVASLYRELGIPAQIYMGLSSDGFIQIDDTGRSNPWKVTANIHQEYKDKGLAAEYPRYPWASIPWPSCSGPGMKMPAANINIGSYGHKTVNWFDENVPSHARNAVNEAYRASLLPMPPLAKPADAECIIQLGPEGKGKTVLVRPKDSPAAILGVVADEDGTAWFKLPKSGRYIFEYGGQTMQVNISSRADYATIPGFARIPRFSWSPGT